MDKYRRFWKKFDKLKNDLYGESPSHEAMNTLLESLNIIDNRLYFHLGSRNDQTDLILSAEGHADLMDELEALVSIAPTTPGWGFIAAFDGMLLFGERSDRTFPNDGTGDALYRMASGGDKLWKSRDVNFSLVFRDASASKCAFLSLSL